MIIFCTQVKIYDTDLKHDTSGYPLFKVEAISENGAKVEITQMYDVIEFDGKFDMEKIPNGICIYHPDEGKFILSNLGLSSLSISTKKVKGVIK